MDTLGLISFIVSFVLFMFYFFYAIDLLLRGNNQKLAHKAACIGTVSSAVLYYLPYYMDSFHYEGFASSFLKSFFLSFHHAIRLFVVDANYGDIQDYAESLGTLGSFYSALGIILLLTAPVLTFTFLMSFMQDFNIIYSVWFGGKGPCYVFSEFNEQSLYLAADIKRNHPKSNIVFMGVDREDKKEYDNVKTYTKMLRPRLLKNNIIEMSYVLSKYRRDAKFFIIGENESNNADLTISMLMLSSERSKREIYVRLKRDDRLLDDLPQYENTEVFRIEHVYSAVINRLEKMGRNIIETACVNGNKDKVISALVVGLGNYGTEMVKNLSWITQVDGYTTKIYAFDKDEKAKERFEHLCPAFFAEDRADRHCDITISSGVDVGTSFFDRELEKLKDVGYVFVALGDDNLNVNTAYEIRSLFARMDKYPIIQTVVRNAEASKLLSNCKNYLGGSYDIDYIGSFEEIYSYEAITDSQNRNDIINANLKWISEEKSKEYISHEEQYRSGKADIIHKKLLAEMGLQGVPYKKSCHRRWVNFMFSEGYVYGPKKDMISKTAKALVPFEKLKSKVE